MLSRIKPSPTLELNAKALLLKKQGVDIINLTVGEPDFPTPPWICEAAYQGIQDGFTKYTPVDGLLDLKIAIQHKLMRENNLTYELNEITVGNGGKQVIFNALLATLKPGDEVLIPRPYWVSYPDMTLLCGGTPVFIPCGADFKITPKALEATITPKTRWLILNSPSNPTGVVYSKEDLLGLSQVLLKHPHVWILSDDIYEHLVYDDHLFCSIIGVEPKLKPRTLIVNGVSKAYAMTGWRLGYGAGHASLISGMTMIQSHTTSNASSVSQVAAIAALNGPQDFLKGVRESFQERRDFLLESINLIPNLSCQVPEGAFYLYIKVQDEFSVCQTLLDKAGIMVVPGSAFGHSPYIRLSYAVSMETLQRAVDKMRCILAEA